MPDPVWLIVRLFGGVLGYGDVLWIATIAACLLLVVSAIRLLPVASNSGSGVPTRVRRWPPILLWAVLLISLWFGLADWLGVPDVNDYTTPWHVTITLWILASLPPALAFLRGRSRHPLLALLCGVVWLALFALMMGASLRLWEHGVAAPAALVYAGPAPVGSVLLAWTLTSGRRRYALYIATWFVVLASLALRLYLNVMSTPMYQVQQYSAVPESSPEHAKFVALAGQAAQAQLWISAIYFAVCLALLLLPLILSLPTLRALPVALFGIRDGHGRHTSAAEGNAGSQTGEQVGRGAGTTQSGSGSVEADASVTVAPSGIA